MADRKKVVRSTTPVLDSRLQDLDGVAKLRALQAGRGLTNLDISRGAGIYPQWVSQVLNGERKNDDTVTAIAAGLGIPREEVEAAIAPATMAEAA